MGTRRRPGRGRWIGTLLSGALLLVAGCSDSTELSGGAPDAGTDDGGTGAAGDENTSNGAVAGGDPDDGLGSDATGSGGAGAGADGAGGMDPTDAATSDAATSDAATSDQPTDGAGPCVLCEPPPGRGCRYENQNCESCGELVCDEGGTGGPSVSCVSCAPPREGCRYESGDCQSCGRLVCEGDSDVPMVCVSCANPPAGCRYEGTDCQSCGRLACDDGPVEPEDVCVSCAPPPEGCRAEGVTCDSCGQLVCDDGGGDGGSGCGLPGATQCEEDQFCDLSGAAACGESDVGGQCRERPGACSRDCPMVCGCDGEDYCNVCVAGTSGVSVAHDGPCRNDGGDGTMDCAPMDAEGRGPCDALLGYGWDGSRCVEVNGCRCQGADCEGLYPSLGECLGGGNSCAAQQDCRTQGCADGQSCESCWTGFACLPAGAVC